jgi:hypothetical protein
LGASEPLQWSKKAKIESFGRAQLGPHQIAFSFSLPARRIRDTAALIP